MECLEDPRPSATQQPPNANAPAEATAASFEAIVSRVATKLHALRGAVSPVEFDRLVDAVVLDVVRYAVRWIEEDPTDAPPSTVHRPGAHRDVLC